MSEGKRDKKTDGVLWAKHIFQVELLKENSCLGPPELTASRFTRQVHSCAHIQYSLHTDTHTLALKDEPNKTRKRKHGGRTLLK